MNSPTPVCDNYIVINGQKICSRLVHINTIGDVINRLVEFILPLAAIILFLVIVWGGFDFLTSAGSPEKVKSARAKITSSIIGFIILVFAFFITKLLASLFGMASFF